MPFLQEHNNYKYIMETITKTKTALVFVMGERIGSDERPIQVGSN
jgi:hypothetical protein